MNLSDPNGHSSCAGDGPGECEQGAQSAAQAGAVQAAVTASDRSQQVRDEVGQLNEGYSNLPTLRAMSVLNAMFASPADEVAAMSQAYYDNQLMAQLAASIELDNYQRDQEEAAAANQCSGFCPGQWLAAAWKPVVTVVAGVATFAGCEALTAGIGTIGCAAAAGAVSGAIGGALNCGHGNMAECVAGGAAVGAATGALMGGAFQGASALLGSAADATEEGGSLLGRLAESCATNSFTAGTLVVMADGTIRPISQVKIGDKVEATDPKTGRTAAATVSHLFLNDDHRLADVVVREGNGAKATLHATQGHRFWDQTLAEWVLTSQLRPGDTLRSDDGGSVVVEGIHSWQGSEWMYDLTVDGVHTFYVMSGSVSMLVHNCPITPQDSNPFNPDDVSTNDWGKQIWGEGRQQALDAIGQRTPQELTDMGLTPQAADGLTDFYVDAANRGLGGGWDGTAGARAQLMYHINMLLSGG